MKEKTINFLRRKVKSEQIIASRSQSIVKNDYSKGYYQGKFEAICEIADYLEKHESVKILDKETISNVILFNR